MLTEDGTVTTVVSRFYALRYLAPACPFKIGIAMTLLDAQNSPLYDLPSVFLTPHIAGSLGNELERLGRTVVEEAERLVDGLPLLHQVLQTDLDRVA